MTLVVVCGAECGIITAGLGAATDSHWTVGTGGAQISIENTIVRSGSHSFKFVPSANNPYLYRSCPTASKSVIYERAFFRQNGNPTSLTSIFRMFGTGTDGRVFIGTDGVLGVKWGAGGTPTFGPSVTADTWFGVEVEFDNSVNPHVLKWRIWTSGTGWVDQTNATVAEAAQTVDRIEFGMCETEHQTSGGYILYADDVIIGEGTTPGADYGATGDEGKVLRYRPDADGTHSFTAGDFGYDTAGADVGVSDTGVWAYVDDDDQTSITDGVLIRQKVVRTTGYIAVGFTDEPTETVPRAVAVTSTHHSSSTGANQHSLRVSDDSWTHETAVLTNDDISDTTAHFRHKVLAVRPSDGTAWTKASVNSTQVRWGYSGDVTDIPYLDSVSLEVAWTTAPSVPQKIYPDADVADGGWTTTPLWSKIEEVSADGTVITATAS